jgi:hypothetical protein
MIFWKKTPVAEAPRRTICDHHRIIVEKDEKTSILTPAQFEKAFGVVYLPHIEFPLSTDFAAISQKINKYRNKGLLDQKQLWLGAYFQKEIQEPFVPPVRLRWIEETFNLMSELATHQNLSHIVLFVSRLIKKGEQLCYNYGPDYWKRRTPPQKC